LFGGSGWLFRRGHLGVDSDWLLGGGIGVRLLFRGSRDLLAFLLGLEGLLLLDVLGEHLLILGSGFSLSLEVGLLGLLVELLSSDSFLSDESLDFRCFEEGFVLFLDFSVDNVLSNIVLLSESEHLPDIVGSLGSKLSRSVSIGDAL